MSERLSLDNDHWLAAAIAASPLVSTVFSRWERLDLPDGWLVAGTVVQTYWNHAFGYPATHGIDDIDLVYFDDSDLSEDSEAAHQSRVESLFRDVAFRLDVKNEARVHLWYERKFGVGISPYPDVASAIETFPTTVGAIGLRPHGHCVEVLAPFGLDDLQNLVVRPNKKQVTQRVYESKVERWRTRWPDLDFLPWTCERQGDPRFSSST
ncbi:MAG: nucleotidyltransferase family protein [Pseudomonadota bacterium]